MEKIMPTNTQRGIITRIRRKIQKTCAWIKEKIQNDLRVPCQLIGSYLIYLFITTLFLKYFYLFI